MNVRPTLKAFDDVVEDISGGNRKVPKTEYQSSGAFQIVDQGQDFVGGYTDDASCLVQSTGPWIVFGDHTRALKYLDTPFCMGADGVKVLRPRNSCGLDAKFLYHFLSASDIPSAGYSRHFKFLRRLEIPLPPLDEQRRIAAILDKADALRRKRRRALDLLDGLTQSIFLEMFGDPISNPHGYSSELLGNVGRLDRGVSKHRPRNDPALMHGDHALIQTGDVTNSGGYIRSYSSTYSDVGLKQSKKWPAGTLCITIAANIAQTGILTFPACFPDSVVGFVHKRPAMSEYIRVWLTFLRETLERTAPAVAQKNINLQILRGLEVMMPPYSMIEKFAERMERRSAIDVDARALASRYDAMFNALQHRAFSGQL